MITLDNMDTELEMAIENINQSICIIEAELKELMEPHPKYWNTHAMFDLQERLHELNTQKKDLCW